ncbi:hypothetical protein ACQEU6_46210 [Spirillospora sp. CA-108201]
MAMSGPQHYKEAQQLLEEARHERDETQRARKIDEAQAHAALALVTATLHAGQVSQDHLHEWRVHGVKI